MAQIYIVEDDTNILEIETYALHGSGFDVTGFESAKPFYEAMEEKEPQLVILDIMLPGEDGLSVLKRLREDPKTRKIPVMMVTAKTTEIDTVKGLDAGADDYMTKPFGIMELISRVKALLRRAGLEDGPEVLRSGSVTVVPDKRQCVVAGEEIDLTYKEFELLTYLMRNAGIVVRRDVLLDRIWGIDFEGETRTLDVHIRSLRAKLGEAGSHIQTVRNVGYMVK